MPEDSQNQTCPLHDAMDKKVKDLHRVMVGDKEFNLPGVMDMLREMDSELKDIKRTLHGFTMDKTRLLTAAVVTSSILSTVIPILIALILTSIPEMFSCFGPRSTATALISNWLILAGR